MTHQICTVLNEAAYHHIIQEAEKRNTSKSKVLSQIVSEYYAHGGFNDSAMRDNESHINSLKLQLKDNEKEIGDLTNKLEWNEQLITQLQSENGFLKQEYAKATETLNKFLLPQAQPKKSFWDRFRRKNK